MSLFEIRVGEFESASVSIPVEYRVIAPTDLRKDDELPCLLFLHGANSSSKILESVFPLLQEMWAQEQFPRAVVACASTPTKGGFYLDHPGAEQWESLVTTDFPALLQSKFGVASDRLLLFGASMGGYGVLKAAFRAPEKYVSVAAIEPVLFPADTAANIRPRNTIGVLAELRDEMIACRYRLNHPAAILRDHADHLREVGLPIYLECGDQDCFFLQDGAEHLHRALWELDIAHEYRLVLGADHIGPEMQTRMREALAFLGRTYWKRFPKFEPEVPRDIAEWLEGEGKAAPPIADFNTEYGPLVLRKLLAPLRSIAADKDATVRRRYGQLP